MKLVASMCCVSFDLIVAMMVRLLMFISEVCKKLRWLIGLVVMFVVSCDKWPVVAASCDLCLISISFFSDHNNDWCGKRR